MSKHLVRMLILALPYMGQNQRSLPPDSSGSSTTVPTHALDFRPSGPISGLKALPAIMVPFQCTGDGATLVSMLDPAQTNPVVFSIKDKIAKKITLDAISGFEKLNEIDFYPILNGTAFLVEGTPKSAAHAGHAESQDRQRPALFVFELNADGALKRATELPPGITASRLAVLPSGDILIAGFSPSLNQQILQMYSPTGQLVKTIDQPMSTAERHANGSLVNPTTFATYKEDILAWRTGTSNPVLDIGAQGTTREVSLSIPKGDVISDLLPSDDQWVVHVQPSVSSGSNGQLNTNDLTYLEISAMDGRVIRKLTMANTAVSTIACKKNGLYVSYAADQNRNLIEYSAR